MAKVIKVTSDLSGEETRGSQLVVKLHDGRRAILDVTDAEALQFAAKGRAYKSPGRKAQTED